MRRWFLPLLPAALLAASGCVTHPAPTRSAQVSPAALPTDHKQPAGPRPVRSDTGPGLPLSLSPEPPNAPGDDRSHIPARRAPATREPSDESRYAQAGGAPAQNREAAAQRPAEARRETQSRKGKAGPGRRPPARQNPRRAREPPA